MTIKVLVVDDEPDVEVLIRQRFRHEMRQGAYHFLFARNGLEALAVLREAPDVLVVLSDINMPVMDGLALLGRLRELGPQPPAAVVVSAYGDMPNIRAAMNQGAYDFLTKPIDFQDFETTILRTHDEVRQRRQAAADQQRLTALDADLARAAEIQRTFLPPVPAPFPDRADVDLFAAMTPARAVGGDFFDYFLIPHPGGERIGLVIGDVSGKGVPAALFMAVCRTLLRAEAMRGLSPGDTLRQVNRQLLRDVPSALFVTVFFASLDPRSGVLSYCNGGHNPPLLMRHGGVEPLPGRNALVGALEDAPYRNGQVELRAGDGLLFYTDGVTEALDPGGEQFGRERLVAFLQSGPCGGAEALVTQLTAAVNRFTASAPQSDDITVLALRYLGPGGGV